MELAKMNPISGNFSFVLLESASRNASKLSGLRVKWG
jgi:hypothetical protein